MSERDFPTLTPTGQLPKLDSIFDVSAKFLGELRLWFEMNPPRVPLENVLGFPVQSRFLDRSATTVNVASTATETTIYTADIGGGQMGTDRMLRLTLNGDWLYNNSTANTVTLRVKFGGTTILALTSSTGGAAISATRVGWSLRLEIGNADASNSQNAIALLYGIGAAFKASLGNFDTSTGVLMNGNATMYAGAQNASSIDTTITQTLAVTVQWSASSVNNSWRKKTALLELV